MVGIEGAGSGESWYRLEPTERWGKIESAHRERKKDDERGAQNLDCESLDQGDDHRVGVGNVLGNLYPQHRRLTL